MTKEVAVFEVWRTESRPSHSLRRGAVALSLAVGLTVVSIATAQAADPEEDGTPLPGSVATTISRANTSLTKAVTRLQHRRKPISAVRSLAALRTDVSKAHKAGMAQIGRPPADPESDDPPGPVSVVAVLNFEHQVAVRLLPAFNGLRRRKVVLGLRNTLSTTFTYRNRMLNAVIALPPEGAGADYADGMADTIGIYATEVNLYTAALNQWVEATLPVQPAPMGTYRLTPAGHSALQIALVRVGNTRTKFDTAFGGGE